MSDVTIIYNVVIFFLYISYFLFFILRLNILVFVDLYLLRL